MKRFLALIALLAIYAIPATAQQIPLTITCMADDGKQLEIDFCQAVIAAARVNESLRESTQEDAVCLQLMVIPKQDAAGEFLAMAAHVAFTARSLNGNAISVATACDIVRPADCGERASAVVGWTLVSGARWLQRARGQMPNFAPEDSSDSIRLETSPP